jgi:hypothetical protein
MDDRKFQEERKIIKSCSSDDAKMASLSKDDPFPSSLLGDLFLPAFPFFLSIILLKQFSAVNISVLFSEPIAHVHSSENSRKNEKL